MRKAGIKRGEGRESSPRALRGEVNENNEGGAVVSSEKGGIIFFVGREKKNWLRGNSFKKL